MMKARVIEERKTNYVVKCDGNEYVATVRGSFFDEGIFPKVGDFVECALVADDKAVIEKVQPRRTVISRKAVGKVGEQIIVANVDVMFIVVGLDGDFNLSRIERYLLLAKQSHVVPVVVLNKADSVPNPEEYVKKVQQLEAGLAVHAVSALTGENIASLSTHITPETTIVLLGSSGAGKSTIVNSLLQSAVQAVQSVRTDDSRGRHTTTTRQLFSLRGGGYLIDTPGMRELGIQSDEEEESELFSRVEVLGHGCKYSGCDHEKSEGCAVVGAVEKGDISERQVKNYLKLQRERVFEESKTDSTKMYEHRQKQKKLLRGYKEILKRKDFLKGQ